MVEHLPERDLLVQQFNMFRRHPLAAVQTNTMVSSVKLNQSTLHHASQVINSMAGKDALDHELISSAYKCLYGGSINILETGLILKKHQHYIITLTGSKSWRLAYMELATIHGVFTGSSKYTHVPWCTLLGGVDEDTAVPVSLVVSYHFLVLQTLLQAISANLQTLTKGNSDLDCSIFDRVAESYLSGSNMHKWMQLLDSFQLRKYHTNTVKILGGFVKIAEFLRKKDHSTTRLLDLSICHLKLKLYEYELKTNNLDASEPNLPEIAEWPSTMLPYAKDLYQTLSETSCTSSLLPKLSDYCQSRAPKAQEVPSHITQIMSSELTDDAITKLVSYIQNSSPESLLLPFHLEILNQLHKLKLDTQLNCLADAYLHKVQFLARKPQFDYLLPSFIPQLAGLLADTQLLKLLRQLEIVCFNHHKATALPESLATSIEILLKYCQIGISSLEIAKSSSRIERFLESLASLGNCSNTNELAYSYLCSFPNKTQDTPNRLLNTLTVCLLNSPKASQLWFGSSLKLTDSQKVNLFKSLLVSIAEKEPTFQPTDLVSVLKLSSRSAYILCLYLAALSFQMNIDLSNFHAVDPENHLQLAYIRVQALRRKDEDYVTILHKIHSDVTSWISLSITATNDEHSIILDILGQLYNLGYFNLTTFLVALLKSTKKFVHNLSRFRLELLSADLHLKLAKLSEVPGILQEAGGIMKMMHQQGSQVDCNLLIRWKLIQLEYFVRMQDASKISGKFEDIGKLMLKYPEYNIRSDSSDVPLTRRLECLWYLAKLLILISKSNSNAGSYVLSLKNLKLALKVMNSIFRKLETSGMDNFKLEIETSMLSSYSTAYTLCRHLGLLKDAIFYLEELEKLNGLVQSPMINCLFYFELSTFFSSIGKEKECLEHIEMGRDISKNSNMSVLNYIAQCSSIVHQMSFLKQYDSLKEKLVDFQDLRCSRMDDIYEALSEEYLLNAKFEVEFSLSLKLDGQFLSAERGTSTQKRSMIIKAMSVVASNLHEVKTILLRESPEDFDQAIKFLPHFASLGQGQVRDIVQKKLLDCKEILNNCLQKSWSRHLEVRKAKHINALFNRCVFLLSFFAVLMPESARDLLNNVHHLLDMPKHLPYTNQQKVINSQHTINESGNELFPILDENSVISNSLQADFDENLRNLLPTNWVVVTLDVCGITGDLVLSKFCSNEAYPHFYKMPMRSKLSSFQHILEKLSQIIEDSNRSTTYNVTSKVKTKEDRKKWWQLRFNLDLQLESLLADVEKHAIGSFNGIFDRPNRTTKAYQDFRSKLSEIWRSMKKNRSSLELSDNIVDLYYCAKPFNTDGSFDPRCLEDLVAFTVDELTNSKNCPKLDMFRLSNLYGQLEELYNSADTSQTECKHLVLVPSSACCSFPWESLSIFSQRSISRVPSIAMLTSLLQKHRSMKVFDSGIKNQVFYLVNPGQDLKRTQQKFEPILKSIPGAEGLSGCKPNEEYLVSHLYASGLYIYLGHGGGEQYMRTSSLFKATSNDSNQHLPPAILMGCSSGAYQANGDLEPTSNVFNWLICGAPMVVANLWDITDKDIDIFSDSVFAKWGLLPGQKDQVDVDICQAVGSSRASCTLKYLNGAAPIVHGLPLYFH